jgi:hypothetical protein
LKKRAPHRLVIPAEAGIQFSTIAPQALTLCFASKKPANGGPAGFLLSQE